MKRRGTRAIQPCNLPADLKIRRAIEETLNTASGRNRQELMLFLLTYTSCPLYVAEFSRADFIGQSVSDEEIINLRLPTESMLLAFPNFRETCLIGPERIPIDTITYITTEGLEDDEYYVEVLMDMADLPRMPADQMDILVQKTGMPESVLRSYYSGKKALAYTSFIMAIDRDEPVVHIINNVCHASDCDAPKERIYCTTSLLPMIACLEGCETPTSLACATSRKPAEAWSNWIVTALDALRRRTGNVHRCKRSPEATANADPWTAPIEESVTSFMQMILKEKMRWMKSNKSPMCPIGAWTMMKGTATFTRIEFPPEATNMSDIEECIFSAVQNPDIEALVTVQSMTASQSRMLLVSGATKTAARSILTQIHIREQGIFFGEARVANKIREPLSMTMWR